jgi:hypothetical protein
MLGQSIIRVIYGGDGVQFCSLVSIRQLGSITIMPFKKGDDPNRYVRKNEGLVAFHAELGEMLRKHSRDAVLFMVDTMNDEKANLKLRQTAAKEILDRGLGKPVDVTIVRTVSETGKGTDVAKMSDAELEQMIQAIDPIPHRNGPKEKPIEGETIENELNQ